ncbi:MAG: hypothetical protein QGH93_06930 [Gammaproteobacteria bacterium]|nr:hypothetical protein [Gammaproteobacteria bacterium]
MSRINKLAWVTIAASLSGFLVGCGDSPPPEKQTVPPSVFEPVPESDRDLRLSIFFAIVMEYGCRM